jgi:hypothetical protein
MKQEKTKKELLLQLHEMKIQAEKRKKKEVENLIVPLESNPGCELCPNCQHETLPKIRGFMTGRMCSRCKAIVDRAGKIEK